MILLNLALLGFATIVASMLSSMKKSFSWFRAILLGLWFAALLFCAVWFLQSGKTLYEILEYCRELMLHSGNKAIVLFILLAWVRGFLFIPSWIFLTIAGLTFGLLKGGMIMYIADLGSAILEFAFIRYVARDFLGVHKRPVLAKYNEHLRQKGFATVVFLRLIPVFHFDVLNFALGVSAVRWSDYFWGTLIAIIPGIVAYVLLGAGVEQLSYALTGLGLIVVLAFFGWRYGPR